MLADIEWSGRATIRRLAILAAVAASSIFGGVAHAQPAAPAPLASESEILARYCAAGPVRARAAALVAEGQAAVDVASVVPNPTVSLEHNRSFTAAEDTETIVGVGFPLGIGGRRFLLSDAADERLDEKTSEAKALLLEGAFDLREALVRAVAERERTAVVEGQQKALAALGATLAGLKTGGETSQHDLLRHGLELEVHSTRAALQAGKTTAAKRRLGAYVDRPVDLAPLDLSTLASEPPPPKKPAHPRLKSLDAAIRAAEYEADAGHRRWVPDLDLFFGYRQVTALEADTGHGFALRVAMPLTFFDHGQGEASVAEASAARARAEKAELLAKQDAEEKAADDALGALALPAAADGGDTVARANKLLEQAKTLYLAGEGSIGDLLAATALAESSAMGRIDTEEARALARTAKSRTLGSLFDPAHDRASRGAAL
jgi:outer membrane protein TolC